MFSLKFISLSILAVTLSACAPTLTANLYHPDFKKPLPQPLTLVPVEAKFKIWPTVEKQNSDLPATLRQRILSGERNGVKWLSPEIRKAVSQQSAGLDIQYLSSPFNAACREKLTTVFLKQGADAPWPAPTQVSGWGQVSGLEIKNALILKENPFQQADIKQCLMEAKLPERGLAILLSFNGNTNPDIFEEFPPKRDFVTGYFKTLGSYYFPKPNAYEAYWTAMIMDPRTYQLIGLSRWGVTSRPYSPNGGSSDTNNDDFLPGAIAAQILAIQRDHLNLQK